MNIYRLKKDLEAVKQICQTLSTEEYVKLNIGLKELCDNRKYDQVLFWGRIRGIKNNYYIAMGIKFKDEYEFPSKKFYYATENFIFKELPFLIQQFKDKVEEFNSYFEGNPETILWENPEKEKQEDQEEQDDQQKKEENEEIDLDKTISDSEDEEEQKTVLYTKFTELDRLAYIVRAIEVECASLPVGSLKINTNHEMNYNQNFKGLSLEESLDIKNWMHFRQPLSESKKLELEKPEAVFNKKLLECLEDDLPKNCWSIKQNISDEIVTVRSYVWPGFLGY